ncbi:RNA-directed DNA polymerase, eukaryota [Tanacetum coccineum]
MGRSEATGNPSQMSHLIFVTNFPSGTSARQLWDICEQYGQVVDSFIPSRVSKDGKIFSFVRFIKVKNLKVLGFENLTIRILSWFFVIQPWSSEFRVEDQVIWVDVEGWNPEFILDDNVSSSEGDESEDYGSFEDICSGVQGQEAANLFNEEKHIVNSEEKYADKEQGISDDPSKPPGFTNVVQVINNENLKGDNEVNGVECLRENNSVTQDGTRSVGENHHSELNNGRDHMASNSRVDSSLPKCPRIDSSLLEK